MAATAQATHPDHPRTVSARWTSPDRIVLAFAVLISAVVAGPMLRPGYPLRFDLVSVPHPVFSWDTFGLGGGTPRAVPLDAVVVVLAHLVPAAILTQVMTLAALAAAGTGVARLADVPLPGRLLAALAAIWNPFVMEQLAIGHVPHLMAYAAMPWVLRRTLAVMHGGPLTGMAVLAAIVALGSVTPGGGVLCCAVVLAGVLVSWRRAVPARWLRAGGVLVAAGAVQLPWLVTGSLAVSGFESTQASNRTAIALFSLRGETGWGRAVDALGLAGMWNSTALPASRLTVLANASTVVVVALALLGAYRLVRNRSALTGRGGNEVLLGLGVVAGGGYLIAIAPLLPGGTDLLSAAMTAQPGLGLLRDSHRWLAPLALLAALLAGHCIDWASGRSAGLWSRALFAGLILVATMPDMAFGLSGRLQSWTYPPDLIRAAALVNASPDSSRVLVLPWSTFRRFAWTDGSTVLDPAPRMLAREVLTSRVLIVSGQALPQEGAVARRVDQLISAGELTAPQLRSLGIGWVLAEKQPGASVPALPAQWHVALAGPAVQLYRSPAPLPRVAGPSSENRLLAIASFAIYAVLLCSGGVAMIWGRRPAWLAPRHTAAGDAPE